VRTLGLLPRTVAAVLAILLAGPLDLAQIDFEAPEASPPSASLAALARKVRLKSHSPWKCRPSGSLRPDQDDPKDGDSSFRPVPSSAQPSDAPRVQTSLVAPLRTSPAVLSAVPDFSRFCRLRC
jgi:hypothetical protein